MCLGTHVYDMYISSLPVQNDIWQAQSWASVQYDLSWKILHYYMRTVYRSILVSAYQYEGYIGIYVVNDMQPSTAINYTLDVQVVAWQTVRCNYVCVCVYVRIQMCMCAHTCACVWVGGCRQLL